MTRSVALALLLSLISIPAGAQASGPAVPSDGAPPAAASPAAESLPAAPAPTEPAAPSEVERRIDVLAAEVEKLRLGEVIPQAEGGAYGLGPAASKVYRVERGVSLGGYGELLYRNFEGAGKNDAFDFQRAILYVGYKFDDKFVLNTEIEIEHVKEVFLEFAYLDYLWRPELAFRAGLLLLPMGLVNELHEPTVFLGALRPEVEQRILPSTWRENGLGVFGELGPISYRAYLVNGLKGSGFSAQGLRGGRQKGAEAVANDFAGVARADYTAVPGLLVGGSAYYGGSGQELATHVPTFIYEGHLDFKWRGLELRGLFARASLQNVGALNDELKLTEAKSIGRVLQGFYAQAGFDVLSLRAGSDLSLTPFVRWEELDTQREVPSGFSSSPSNDNRILTLGASFQPLDSVVLKADFQRRFPREGAPANQTNALLGYIF